MTPEQRIALRLLGNGKPPVDIEAIAKKQADIEYDRIPADADAILLYPSRKRSRPLIILAGGRAETRMRFTLAHELGHIAIPWHVGEMVYHQHWSGKFDDYSHGEMEGEANRFAAEILMPSEWLSEITQSRPTVCDMFKKVLSAKVSGPAAALALVRNLPSGYIFAQADKATGSIMMSGRSPGTVAVLPDTGSLVGELAYEGLHAEHEQVEVNRSVFHWWRFLDKIPLSNLPSALSSRELLEQIYADSGITGEEKRRLDCRISGIIGAANSRLGRALWRKRHAVLTQAFGGRGQTVPIVGHPQFDVFLALRAKEITSRDD